ncbi:MAG: hypothetical protein KC425_21695 [Anaerolineales bacterium]|nr:hypothetical protein [Anaerolineales bacterium]
MKLLTKKAKIVCRHNTGRVQLRTPQDLVYVAGEPLLVEADPEQKVILGCSNIGPTIKPCALTLKVTAGYSRFIYVEGKPVCLDNLVGITDGTPPTAIQYIVKDAGQDFVTGEG